MKGETASLMAVGRRVAVLLVLVTGTLFLMSQPPEAYADQSCFYACDANFGGCSSCCVYDPPGSDCYSCPSNCSSYASCAAGCFGSNTWGGGCRNQTQCQNLSGNVYADCMMNNLGGECLNPDGTVNASCCYNISVQEFFGCCYP